MKRIFGLALSLLMVAGLGAYDLTDESPTEKSTGGLFNQEFDQYLSVTEYSELDSNVLFLSFDFPTLSESFVQAGTGINLSETLYVATQVQSSLSAENGSISEVVDDANSEWSADGSTLTMDVDSRRQVTNNGNTRWDVMGGLTVAGMPLGIKNTFFYGDSSTVGTYGTNWGGMSLAPTATFEAGSAAVSGIQTSNDVTVQDASGNNLSKNVTEYAEDGFNNNLNISDTLQLGTTLAAGPGDLSAALTVTYQSTDQSQKGSYTDFVTAYSNYLPTYAGIAGATSHEVSSVEVVDTPNQMTTGLSVGYEYPLSEVWTLNAGLGYSAAFSLSDKRELTGSRTGYSAVYNIATTSYTTTVQQLNYNSMIEESFFNQDINVPVSLEYNSPLGFSVALGYRADIGMYSGVRTVSSSRSQVQTVNSNIGTISEEEVITRVNETYRGSETTTDVFSVGHAFSTGAKLPLGEKLTLNLGSNGYITSVSRSNAVVAGQGVREYNYSEEVDRVEDLSARDYQWETTTASDGGNDTMSLNGSGLTVTYTMGLTYQLNEQIKLDLEKDGVTGDVFNLEGWSLLMTMKY